MYIMNGTKCIQLYSQQQSKKNVVYFTQRVKSLKNTSSSKRNAVHSFSRFTSLERNSSCMILGSMIKKK